MNHPLKWGIFLLLALFGCERSADTPSPRAVELAKSLLIVDTHIDVPTRVLRSNEDFVVGTDGQFDYPRARAGGLDVPFMSIFIPAGVDEAGEGFARANALIDVVEAAVARAPDKLALARSVADVERNFEAGLISLPLGMENGGPIGASFEHLQALYDRGIRYVTLTHSRSNAFSDSATDPEERWQGLSPAGVELLAKLNALGVMIDVSHLSDKAFWQVLEHSRTPVIASHSSARRFIPGYQRNMDDEMIRAMADNGGVVQINFGSWLVNEESHRVRNASNTAFRDFLEQSGHAPNSDEARSFRAQYATEHPQRRATLDEVLAHFDLVVELAGIDHVGIGSDYDGVGDWLPIGLEDVSKYPNLIDGLLARGYDEEDIGKILGGNLLRVWRAVERFAAEGGS
jgi:membrane dipeptidase